MIDEFDSKIEEAEKIFARVLDTPQPERKYFRKSKPESLNKEEDVDFNIEETEETLKQLIDRIQE